MALKPISIFVSEAGTQGIQGIQGDTGLSGSAVYKGDTGLQGNTGLRGSNGQDGLQGNTGLNGFQGDTGLGNTGIQGDTGIQGLQGDTGNGSGGSGFMPLVNPSVDGDIVTFADTIGNPTDSGILLSSLLTDAPSDGNMYGRADGAKFMMHQPNGKSIFIRI